MMRRYQGYSIILFAAALGRTQMVDILAQNKQGSLGDVAPDGSTIAHLILANWRSSPIVMMEPHRVEGPKVCSSSPAALQHHTAWVQSNDS